jgi:hypothetical protein
MSILWMREEEMLVLVTGETGKVGLHFIKRQLA